MARDYTSEFKSTLAEVSANEAPLILIEINHEDLPQPVRVVNDMQDVTCNGDLYISYPFTCKLPDDYENQLPKAQIIIDNVGRELMYWIDTTGGGQDSTCTFKQILRSNPNVVEWEITMSLFNIQVTMETVSAELGFENLFNKPAIRRRYRPDTAPGIF
jgi:hypothetical protein